MKMPPKIEEFMFAPCGMNCMVCYKHCFIKKNQTPCNGCLAIDETGKPAHCRKCKIKDCIQAKGIMYCFECNEFPCKLIKNIDKSYKQRYNTSLISNSLFVQEYGITKFMDMQHQVYLCSKCTGIYSLHDKICTECGNIFLSK